MTMLTGHRGGRNLWPENSLQGFREVQNVQVEGVEFDVHLTDAGEMVVIHDATLERTTHGTGPVREMTPESRKKTILKDSSECVPLLSEVLELLAGTNLELHVEIKTDQDARPYPGLVEKVIAELRRFDLTKRSLLTCFNHDVLRECRDLAPDIERLCSINGNWTKEHGVRQSILNSAELARYVAVQMDLMAEEWDLITSLLPLDRLGVWTLNTREDLEYWFPRNLAFITSDEPILAADVRNALESRDAANV